MLVEERLFLEGGEEEEKKCLNSSYQGHPCNMFYL